MRPPAPTTLQYSFPAAGPDTMVLTSTVSVSGIDGTVVGSHLAKASFTTAVLKHPQRFKPSPQNLTSATTASGPGSKIKYTVPLLGSTVLGLTGKASN